MARLNRAIELLQSGQPIYYTSVEEPDRNYEGGKRLSATWADMLVYDVEHLAFDMTNLYHFMQGLVAAGPTRSGHRTPCVTVTLPIDAVDEATVRANSWVIKQALAAGVHGLLLCTVESPEACRAFVETARYPFHTGGSGLGYGRRGNGGQKLAAGIWGVSVPEYLKLADPWPMNPEGELILGVKIENIRALEYAEATTKTPGLAFAEWGPGDMGMSMGFPDQHDPPYPPQMIAARARVRDACKAANIFFLNAAAEDDVIEQLNDGVMVVSCGRGGPDTAVIGRKHTNRTMPV